MSEKITAETLIKLSLIGAYDVATCRVCGVERKIDFELIGAGRNGLSLVPDKKYKADSIKGFHRSHAAQCLKMSDAEINQIFKRRKN